MTKEAKALYQAQYYADHREAKALYNARYQAGHKEAIAQYSADHKEAKALYDVQYHADHREAKALYNAQYRAAHKEASAQYQAQYRATHKEAIARQKAQYEATRRKNDPNFRILCALRARLRDALCGRNKSASTLELLGCTIAFLWAHLEKQFVPGMTRENYGSVWHVDHILPCAEFHLQHSEEQEICFHWTNLQPLFVIDNLSKSDKII